MAEQYTGEVVTGPQEYAGPVLYDGPVVPLDTRARENLPTTLNFAGYDTGMKINPALFKVALVVVASGLEELLRSGLIPVEYLPVAASISVVLAGLVRPPAKEPK